MFITRAAVLFIAAWLAASSAFALPLWEITGTRNRVLLLGSIHTLRPSDFPLDPAIAAAVDEADVVYNCLNCSVLRPGTTPWNRDRRSVSICRRWRHSSRGMQPLSSRSCVSISSASIRPAV
jgi:hypothetical protein